MKHTVLAGLLLLYAAGRRGERPAAPRMMPGARRRVILSLAALAVAGVARAQQSGRTYRVGWISTSKDSFNEPYSLAFVQRMRELGFAEGRNLVLERLHGDNRIERMPAVAAQLAKLKCDAFFGGGGEVNLSALAQAHPTTPIVFIAVDFDPVATGDVASLARPGGRVTGITALQSTLPAKRLELLKDALPEMRKLAIFTNEQTTAQLALVQGTARRLGIAVHVVDLRRPPFDFDAAFAEAVREKSDALFMPGSGLFVPSRRLIPDLAVKARLPAVFHQAQWAEAGGLMSYGFNFSKMWRRGAEMLASVLRGAKAGEIPMEQPSEYELVFNLRTAKTLGIRLPQSLLARADRVIE